MNAPANEHGTPVAGHCRSCGALCQHRNGRWEPVTPGHRCRFGATAHNDVAATGHDAELIRKGYGRTPAAA